MPSSRGWRADAAGIVDACHATPPPVLDTNDGQVAACWLADPTVR